MLGTGYRVDGEWRLKGVKSMYEVKTRRCEAQKRGGEETWRNGKREMRDERGEKYRESNVTCNKIM